MSRRSVLVLLAAGTVTACDRSAGCDGEFCGTLVVVQGVEPEPLFPPALQGVSSIALTDLMFLKLADLTSDMNTVGDDGFAPQLARSWTRADPTTVVFVMDPRARWHDGTPVSSHDVEFTFDVYRDTLIGSPKMPLLDRIVSVIATDSGHVEFKFTEAYPEQIYDAVYHMRILPAHLLEDIPRADLLTHQFARNPVGSGPYRFARWVPGEFVELQADSNFYLGRPSLRRVMWRITADKEAALLQLVAGEADAIETIRSAAEIERIRAASDLSLVEYPTSGYQYIQFNFRDPGDPTQPHPLFRTRELRRAIAMSIDVETVLMAVFGTLSGRAYGPVSQVLSIWSDTLPLPPYDTARARASLERLGWRDVDGDGLRERSGIPLRFELV
ncbi:MAG: ABC transporter substrate-binding protein, partial [Gemmatimonadales bacterium]